MSSQSAQGQNGSSSPLIDSSGPPYHPMFAMMGGHPTVQADDPPSAVILAIFVVAAIINLTIWWRNVCRSHQFFLSFFLAFFCGARILACLLRIAWASHPEDAKTIIAAQVFLSAGVVMLFLMNMVFAQRLLRAFQPSFGWNKVVTAVYRVIYSSITADILMVIIALVYSYFTRDLDKLKKARDVQRVGVTYLAVISFLPIPIIALSLLLPRKEPVEEFGAGSMGARVFLTIFSAVLLALGAGFRAGVALMTPRLVTNPAWYHHKACFYVLTYGIEIIVVYVYTLSEFDKRFYIRDSKHRPARYPPSSGSGTLQDIRPSVSEVLSDTEQSRPQQAQNEKKQAILEV
ncbi:Fc.00g055640.m01.CDS01 [Cosmosporella sp. VM-42]